MANNTTGSVDLERVAYHEAGHAVLSVLLGLPLRKVTIKRRGWSVGKTSGRRKTWAYSDAMVRIITRYAGLAAESVHYNVDYYEADASYAMKDIFEASDICEDYLRPLCSSEDEYDTWKYNLVTWLEDETLEQINRHWPAVEAVALALLERQTLTGREVQEIVAARGPASEAT